MSGRDQDRQATGAPWGRGGLDARSDFGIHCGSTGLPHLALRVAALFGVGKWRVAAGTWATLIAAGPACMLVALAGRGAVAAVAMAVSTMAIWAASHACLAADESDPSWVVIDEVAGVLVTFALCPHTVGGLLGSLVLFRLFDVTKPFPCRLVHRRLRRPVGLGVVADDVLAAVWAAGIGWVAAVVL